MNKDTNMRKLYESGLFGFVKIAQQDGALHQGEVYLANQVRLQLQGDEASDQTAAMTVIEAIPYYDQVLCSMQ